ncbi:MAG: hypothetical protein ACI841_000028 [Planctomycetota bacterium]|jgi:hypothetical protein
MEAGLSATPSAKNPTFTHSAAVNAGLAVLLYQLPHLRVDARQIAPPGRRRKVIQPSLVEVGSSNCRWAVRRVAYPITYRK